MDALSPFANNAEKYNRTYCSQNQVPLPPIRSLEDGVGIIVGILRKKVLCFHDVEDINTVYKKIDLLEKHATLLQGCGSTSVLEVVIDRLKGIVGNLKAENLICLYHLQQFSDKELCIEECFRKRFKQFDRSPQNREAIATLLPCCHSEAQYEEDLCALIGSERSKKVHEIVNQKKEKLSDFTKQVIKNKRSQLQALRKENTQDYPSYFDELLDLKCLHLYDHLIQMKAMGIRNERDPLAKKASFSLISHIVLETREAIIQRVQRSIPAEQNNVLFLLGGTGAGKSTSLCFLRGDKMVLEDCQYRSFDEKEAVIGHKAASSCTFLPTIEIVNNVAIVDFPGFDDTNGPIISLGMELALKALISKYQPKVLVLEAITNTDNKYFAVQQLGKRLDRLIANKTDCLLGITKYSKDPHFIEIKKIEERQKSERSQRTDDEIYFSRSIEKLSSKIEELSHNPDKQSEVKEKKVKLVKLQQKLTKLKQKREQNSQQPLPETEEKRKSYVHIVEKENILLGEIGLKKILRFRNLEDPKKLPKFFSVLFGNEIPRVHVNYQYCLDESIKNFLDERFKNNLQAEITEKKDYHITFEDVIAFERKVLNTSLINTMLSLTNPEIGQFLHLPEFDPHIVREYDTKIVSTCLKQYMEDIISTCNIPFIRDKILTKPEIKDLQLTRKLENRFKDLQNFLVMTKLGKIPESKEEADQAWHRMQNQYIAAENEVKNRFQLNSFLKVCAFISLGIPIGIYKLMEWDALRKEKQQVIEATLQECFNNLNNLIKTLQHIKTLENTIVKQEAIDKAFGSVQIHTGSIESLVTFMGPLNETIQARINAVRDAYECDPWDSYVLFLAKEFDLTGFAPNNPFHVACLSAHAFYLIEPELSCHGYSRAISFSAHNQIEINFKIPPFSPEPKKVATLVEGGILSAKTGSISLARGTILIEIINQITMNGEYPYPEFCKDFFHIFNFNPGGDVLDKKCSKLSRVLSAAALFKAAEMEGEKLQQKRK